MLQPTAEQLAVLNRTERLWFRVANLFAGPLKPFSLLASNTWGLALLWFAGGRRFRIHGLENLDDLDKKTSLVMVANHRSFFDFYTIAYAAMRYSRMTRRIFFPVRSTFFYDGPIGAAINLGLSGMAMFPPIMRDKSKAPFNRFALDRMADELRHPGTMIGIHPEGRRNKDADPYSLLPPQPGVGHLACKVEGLRIVPVFVKGLSNRMVAETLYNWISPSKYPIDICFGKAVDYADLLDSNDPQASALAITQRSMDAIKALGEAQRAWERSEGRLKWPSPPLPVNQQAVLQLLRGAMR